MKNETTTKETCLRLYFHLSEALHTPPGRLFSEREQRKQQNQEPVTGNKTTPHQIQSSLISSRENLHCYSRQQDVYEAFWSDITGHVMNSCLVILHFQCYPCWLSITVRLLTFRGWVIKRLSKKETTMEMSQLMERSFPYVSPYIMVKYPDTPLVAITRTHPTKTNHHGRPPWQHFLAEPPLLTLSSGLGLRSSWSPSRLDEGWWCSRRLFIP